jgi:hypothetical protein
MYGGGTVSAAMLLALQTVQSKPRLAAASSAARMRDAELVKVRGCGMAAPK